MSATAWLLWFAAQSMVLLAVLGVAMLGVTGRLTRTHHHGAAPGPIRRSHHHMPSFRHHPAH